MPNLVKNLAEVCKSDRTVFSFFYIGYYFFDYSTAFSIVLCLFSNPNWKFHIKLLSSATSRIFLRNDISNTLDNIGSSSKFSFCGIMSRMENCVNLQFFPALIPTLMLKYLLLVALLVFCRWLSLHLWFLEPLACW